MKVLSLYRFDKEIQQHLETFCEYEYRSPKEVSANDVRAAEVIIGNINPLFLKDAKQLKWLQLYSAGNDVYQMEMLPESCILTNASGTFGLTINEHLIMTTLMLMRNMFSYVEKQKSHQWAPIHQNRLISGSTFVIVGCGDLGKRYAKSIQLLGGYTIGVKRRSVDSLAGFDEIYTADHLDELLPKADVVCLALPKNDASNQMMDKKHIALLKETAYLLNVGRGNCIDEEALYIALEEGKIAGAHLDVFQKEPLSKDHKFWDTKNLIITPHVSGTFANKKTRQLFETLALDNMERYYEKKELRNVVDFKSGYRHVVND